MARSIHKRIMAAISFLIICLLTISITSFAEEGNENTFENTSYGEVRLTASQSYSYIISIPTEIELELEEDYYFASIPISAKGNLPDDKAIYVSSGEDGILNMIGRDSGEEVEAEVYGSSRFSARPHDYQTINLYAEVFTTLYKFVFAEIYEPDVYTGTINFTYGIVDY